MNQIKDIRSIAMELKEKSSIHDTRQPKFEKIINLCDDLWTHFVDDRK